MNASLANDLQNNRSVLPPNQVKWRQIGAFLSVTFGLTWLLDLVLYLHGGLANPAASVVLQFQMLIPAASAIFLGLFFFKDHPLYYRTNRSPSRWFVYYYLLFTIVYGAAILYLFTHPAKVQTISSSLLYLSIFGLLLLVILQRMGKDSFATINMAGGKPIIWLVFGLGMVAFYSLQTGLNWLFKMGAPVDLNQVIPQLETQTLPNTVILASLALNTILIGPFLGLIIAFGEEYGWRGYLQPALLPLGKIKGVFCVGVIWGIWHWPIIAMGYNYPGQPILGSIMMTLYTIALAFILAYAVFKGKGLWIAAFLHALNNQTISFFTLFVYSPTNPLISFGSGVLGILCFGIVIFFILRDPIWKEG